MADRISVWMLSEWSRAKRRLPEEVLTQLCISDPRGEKLQKKMILTSIFCGWPASWSSGQGLWLLIMRSRFRFPVLPWEFFLAGKDSVVTMVWVVSRFTLKDPSVISSSCISPLTSSGQCSRASWASQPQKSATLSPQSGGKPRKFIRTRGVIGGKKNILRV